MKKSMKKSIKKALALMLVVCMLPFTDYATAFAVSNRQMDNIQTDSMETGAGDATVNVEADTVSENQVQGEGAGNKETAETVNTEAETLETAETVDTEAETPDSLNLNENMVLNEDMVVYDLSVSEGTGSNGYPIDTTLDLNGHTLTVLNNATFESGSILSFNGGSLCVSRNVELQERCNFAMEDEEDYLFVGGNLDWKIRCDYDNSDEYDYDAVNLSKGTIELQGDTVQPHRPLSNGLKTCIWLRLILRTMLLKNM